MYNIEFYYLKNEIHTCNALYRRLGYMSMEELLEDIPDTVRISRDYTGQARLFGVSNQDTEHIADMVKKQKKGTFNPYKPPPKVITLPSR